MPRPPKKTPSTPEPPEEPIKTTPPLQPLQIIKKGSRAAVPPKPPETPPEIIEEKPAEETVKSVSSEIKSPLRPRFDSAPPFRKPIPKAEIPVIEKATGALSSLPNLLVLVFLLLLIVFMLMIKAKSGRDSNRWKLIPIVAGNRPAFALRVW